MVGSPEQQPGWQQSPTTEETEGAEVNLDVTGAQEADHGTMLPEQTKAA